MNRASSPNRLDELQETLATLGAESRGERRVKRIAPWLMSLMLHTLLILVGFAVTWTIIHEPADRDAVLIVADFHATEYDPLVTAEQIDTEEQIAPSERTLEAVPDVTPREDLDAPTDPLAMLAEQAHRPLAGGFDLSPDDATASFLGLTTTNARDIVYVIDASGSMIRSLQIVIDELARSLDGLTSRQRFAIVFFQRNEALIVPPRQLQRAGEEEKIAALEWIREPANVTPAGRSNPIQALRAALAMQPDAIFLLSENITGVGQWEIDQEELLNMLDDLNPIDPTSGLRRTQINCVQFLDPDPLDTLRKIAERHGGPRSYRFLDRRELGLAAP